MYHLIMLPVVKHQHLPTPGLFQSGPKPDATCLCGLCSRPWTVALPCRVCAVQCRSPLCPRASWNRVMQQDAHVDSSALEAQRCENKIHCDVTRVLTDTEWTLCWVHMAPGPEARTRRSTEATSYQSEDVSRFPFKLT